MPIYEYQCEQCQYTFDTLQKVSEDPLVECPECKQHALKKLISQAGFRLKGTGWYETDFKGKSKKSESASSDSGASSQQSAKKKTSTATE
ncbi:MAG: zinc ribbon domain-containing protein [Gammaproteobacteria bacterium]|nr:zinc ribbon domain-containing protein [Gammaproteobacteria bacterium]